MDSRKWLQALAGVAWEAWADITWAIITTEAQDRAAEAVAEGTTTIILIITTTTTVPWQWTDNRISSTLAITWDRWSIVPVVEVRLRELVKSIESCAVQPLNCISRSKSRPPFSYSLAGKIVERYFLHALDRYWHNSCLKCSCCNAMLADIGSSCFTRSGMILCKPDYSR